MLSLPLITPRDSHELWFGGSQPYRSASPPQNPNDLNRRNANPTHRAFMPSRSPANSLSALQVEERALRARKQNIASFGYSWIRPAGCAKTMLGMKEEEAEREEAMAAQQAEMNAVEGEGIMDDDTGMREEGMDRDLDDEIPDAEEEGEGLVEEGEEGLEEEEIVDEEGYMERDLDDDIPEGYPEDDYEEYEDFDDQPDLDADVPVAEGLSDGMERDLDDEVPDAAEDGSEQEGSWQHTDTEDELDEDEEEEADDDNDSFSARPSEHFRTSTPNSRGGLPPPPPLRPGRETEAQSRFLSRWSGGGDAFDSSSIMLEEDELRASVTSQSSRRSGFARRFPRRVGGPRDSIN
ncbi:hypothetical protein N7523_003053 [Penicillium sp. IBT 18751x]|nr:hypothetical protein N7523_003053 [Penicillium sp. IBT 18751x]